MKVTLSIAASPLTGSHLITAICEPQAQVTKVEFYIDSVLKTPVDTSPPFTYLWNTTTVPDGQHWVEAKASFVKNKVASAKQQVTVKNTAPIPDPPPVQAPPVNVTLPLISPLTPVKEGNLLTVSDGTWTNGPILSYTRQWTRCDASGANCVPIPSATGSTYLLSAADVGSTIRCWTTAFNAVGSSQGDLSVQTAVVSALAAAVPVLGTPPPVISGTPTQGQALTISNGSWTGSPTSYLRQWTRCDNTGENCVNIAGATASTYVLQLADVGKAIRCWVTAQNATGDSISYRSAATALIAPAQPTPPPPGPLVFGMNITEGQEITAPYNWVATVTPTPDRVEFWADGNLLATDNTAPYSHSLNLPPGPHQVGLCAWNTATPQVRSCSSFQPFITIAGSPAPPPSGFALPTFRTTLAAGDIAYWTAHDSPNSQVIGNGGARDKRRGVVWSTAGGMSSARYSGKLIYAILGFRMVTGYPGRFNDWHSQPDDSPYGWLPLNCASGGQSTGVAPMSFDYRNDSRGLDFILEPEDSSSCGSGGTGVYHHMVLSPTEMENRRGQWVWIWLEMRLGRRDTLPAGSIRLWVAGENTPRVNRTGINTHWYGQHQITLWEGSYDSGVQDSTSVIEIAATRLGRTPQEAYADLPVLWGREGAGSSNSSAVAITSRLSNEAAVPVELQW